MPDNLEPVRRRPTFGSEEDTLGRFSLGMNDRNKDDLFDYRWVRTDNFRIDTLHQTGWDVVEDRNGDLVPLQGRGPGSGIALHGGQKDFGGGKYEMMLMRKRKDLREDDIRKYHQPKADKPVSTLAGFGPVNVEGEQFYVPNNRPDALTNQ